MRRVASRAIQALDSDLIVIGEVLDGFDVLEALNELPTRLPSQQRELSGLASLLALKAGVGLGVVGLAGRGGLGDAGRAFTAVRLSLGVGAAALVGGVDDPRIRSRMLDNRPLTKVRLLSAVPL